MECRCFHDTQFISPGLKSWLRLAVSLPCILAVFTSVCGAFGVKDGKGGGLHIDGR